SEAHLSEYPLGNFRRQRAVLLGRLHQPVALAVGDDGLVGDELLAHGRESTVVELLASERGGINLREAGSCGSIW
ncbi:MAG TPA: hypothetical protein VGP82_22770, partial [Ktedonobacterales bacterium]|nr:hypothetical protein [Ktedonobacterales bacterium]